MFTRREIIVPETHRGLWYENGRFIRLLPPGRYMLPRRWPVVPTRRVRVEQVDLRELDFTIKGQEILTADKVSIRVSILVRYRVLDPVQAMHAVECYPDRLYSDVQLAARRSLVPNVCNTCPSDCPALSSRSASCNFSTICFGL